MTQPQAQADLDKVVQKIQKLFELAGRSGARGATEAEADTATRRAQELMARYNLDVAAIEAASREAADAGAASRVKEEQGRRTGKAWQRQLAKYVAEAHFCYHLIRVDKDWDDEARSGHGGWRKKAVHVFVGRKANVVTAQMMFAYLVDAVEGLAPPAEPGADTRVVVDKTYWGTYRGDGYSVRAVSGEEVGRGVKVAFLRLDDNRGERGEVYETVGEAVRRCVGFATNGYKFFNMGEASTSESFKKGCADRLCERLAQRRADLIATHDARVKQAEADARAEAERAAQARTRTLGADAGAEKAARGAAARAAVEGLAAEARRAPGPDGEAPAPRPEVDDEDWAPPVSDDASADPGAAMVLASVYDKSESEANYELAHDMEPGTLARWRRESEAREAERAARRAEAEATATVDAAEEPVREETEKQRAARKRREAAEMVARRCRWAREDARESRKAEREYARVDHSAYRSGAKAGEKVGLDPQVGGRTDETKKLRS